MIESPNLNNQNIVFLQTDDIDYDGAPSPGIASKNRTIINKQKQSDNMLNFSLDSGYEDMREFGFSTFCFSNKVSGFGSEECSPVCKRMTSSNGFKHSKFMLHKLASFEKLAEYLKEDWENKVEVLINKLLLKYKILINRQSDEAMENEEELQNSIDMFFD
jgi:hypothetical protein